jgi:hypothetical protein
MESIKNMKINMSNKMENISNKMENINNKIDKITSKYITKDNSINLIIISIIIVYLTIKLYYISLDPSTIIKNNVETTIIFIIGLFVIVYLTVYKKSMVTTNPSLMTIYKIIAVIVIFCSVYFFNTFSSSTITIASYIINIIIILSIIVFLAIYFFVFSNYLKTLSGWSGFFTYFLFYIPCLLIDLLNFIIKQYEITTTPVFILFIVEILLILIYIYVPILFNYIDNADTIVLLNEPEFFDSLQTIDDVKTLISYSDPNFISSTSNTTPELLYRKNYSISMWIYLNVNSPNNNGYNLEKTIFKCGTGCPKITYLYETSYLVTDETIVKDKLLVYFTNNRDSSGNIMDVSGVEIKIDKQKWNQLVFNYSSNNADLFINGNLVYSYNFSDNSTNPPVFKNTDLIQYGDTNGLNGSICNLKYHKNPLSNLYIINSYNILQKKNPPINFL